MKIDFIGSGSWKDISSFGNNIIKRGFRASVDEASEKAIKDQKSESWYLFRIVQSRISSKFINIMIFDFICHLNIKSEYISSLFPCIPFQFHRRFHQTMWLFIYHIICIIMEPKSVHDNIEGLRGDERRNEMMMTLLTTSSDFFFFLFSAPRQLLDVNGEKVIIAKLLNFTHRKPLSLQSSWMLSRFNFDFSFFFILFFFLLHFSYTPSYTQTMFLLIYIFDKWRWIILIV